MFTNFSSASSLLLKLMKLNLLPSLSTLSIVFGLISVLCQSYFNVSKRNVLTKVFMSKSAIILQINFAACRTIPANYATISS